MNILLLSSYWERGGAAIASSRLFKALRRYAVGDEVRILLGEQPPLGLQEGAACISTRRMKLAHLWERGEIFYQLRGKREKLFGHSLGSHGALSIHHPWVLWADVIHLHWIHFGFLSLKELEQLVGLGKKVVVTLHDFWWVSSTKHLLDENLLPSALLLDEKEGSMLQRKKLDLLDRLSSELVVPSAKVYDIVKSFYPREKIHIIANALPEQGARAQDDPPSDREKAPYTLLFVAARIDDPIKGYDTLVQALEIYMEKYPELAAKTRLATIGKIKHPTKLPISPIETKHFGAIEEPARLYQHYREASLTISCSRFETFGQTLSESIMMGCPIIAFSPSGSDDIIEEGINGYKIPYRDLEAMADRIAYSLAHHPFKKECVRHSAEQFSPRSIAEKHLRLYHSLYE